MLRTVEYKCEKYEIDTTPEPIRIKGLKPYRPSFARVRKFYETPATGIVANTLRELGQDPKTRVYVRVEKGNEFELVLHLGYRFARSRAWKDLWETARGDKWLREHPEK